MTEQSDEIEMVVAGLVLDPQSNAPIVILKDPNGESCLPIWIGLPEATAIASSLKKVQLARPMTHDLLRNTIDELGGSVTRVLIGGLVDNTFIATLELKVGDMLRTIDARPSDAIALAVRVNCPIYVAATVLAQANVTLIPASDEGSEKGVGEHGMDMEGEDDAAGAGDRAGSDQFSSDQAAADQFSAEQLAAQGRDTNFANIEKEKWEELLAEMDPDDFKYKM